MQVHYVEEIKLQQIRERGAVELFRRFVVNGVRMLSLNFIEVSFICIGT